jgi:hypothetical protein
VAKVLNHIHNEYDDFPIQSATTLWRHMKRLGFCYKETNKVTIPLDSISFVAQRAAYFRRLDDLRANGVFIYYHDETWCNVGEEKRSIWLTDKGEGRLKKSDGKGKRLAISAMINENGFHKESVDIFTCDEDHSMNSIHFINWVEKAASHLRFLHGPTARIAIIIDNATWHNELIDEAKPPKRSWRKDQLQQWLDEHMLKYDANLKKAELLEIAFSHVPPKRYKTNAAANLFNVELVRLPIKHCVLNPIELAWAQLKAYVRSNNTHFRLTDIRSLSEEYIAALDGETSRRFIEHARKAEEKFRAADDFVEETIEPYLLSEDEHNESDADIDTNDEDDMDL